MREGGWRDVFAIIRGRVRQLDLSQRVQIEVFPRRDQRCVRTEESGGDEEGLIAMPFEQADRFIGDHAIGLFVVSAIGGEPTQAPALTGFSGVGLMIFDSSVTSRPFGLLTLFHEGSSSSPSVPMSLGTS